VKAITMVLLVKKQKEKRKVKGTVNSYQQEA